MTWHLQNVGPAMKVKRILRLTRLMPIRCPPSRACEHAYPCSRQGIAPQCPQGVPEARHRHARKGAQTSLQLLGGLRVDGPSQVSRSRMQAGAAGQRVCRRHLATDAAGGSRLCRRGAERGDPSPRPARDPNTEHGRAIDSSGPTPPRAGNRPPQLLQHHRNRSAGAESNSRQPEICPGIGEQLRKRFVTEVRNFADRRQGGSVVSPTGFEPVTH